jgi:hypothetical protein
LHASGDPPRDHSKRATLADSPVGNLLGMHSVPERTAPAPLEEPVDRARGLDRACAVLEYGDDECPCSRLALREIERVARELVGEDVDRRRYAEQLGLEVTGSDRHRAGGDVIDRIRRDLESALATDQVQGTPTLFIDAVVWRGGYDASTLIDALGR